MKKLRISLRYLLYCSILVLLNSYAISSSSNSLLWNVAGKGLEYPIYLSGSLHALPANEFIIYEKVNEILSESNLVVFEVNLLQPDLAQRARERMLMKDITLDQLLNSDDFEKLKLFVEDSLSLTMSALNKVKPLLFSSFLVPKLLGTQPASYDYYFLQKAQELSIELNGLETVDEQFDHFDAIPLSDQAQILMESICNFEEQRKTYFNLVELYKLQDIEGIYNLTISMSAEYPAFKENVLHKRNEKWIPRIIDLCTNRSCFLVFGAAHLAGNNGVIELLRKTGYTVEPVELKLPE